MEKAYFIHSDAISQALKQGARVDFFGGMDADSILRCIGKINFKEMINLGDKLVQLIKAGKTMKITSPGGTDLYMQLDPLRPVYHHRGIADKPNDITFLGGQIALAPVEESMNGKMVFDGALWPPDDLGLLNSAIELTVENGKVILIEGENEAKHFKKWLKSFNHPNCYNVAHISLGFNPGAKLSGNIIEDERVFGCIEIGIGAQSDHFNGEAGRAPSHCDGIMLSPSFWIDEHLIEDAGKYNHPEMIGLANSCLSKNYLKGD
jgi:leucyl aminopeptidase (aminopeptidase T)